MSAIAELKINLPEQKIIKINGEEYPFNIADYEAVKFALDAQAKAKEFIGRITPDNENSTDIANDAVELAVSLVNSIDKILGEGAKEKICEGRAVNLMFLLEQVLTPILVTAMSEMSKSYE